jgi:hypothetical protein
VPVVSVAPSPGAVLVAAAAPGPENVGKGVDRSTRIGVRVEPAAAFSADAAPLADQQCAAEQVGRSWLKVPSGAAAGWNSQRRADLDPVVALFVQRRVDPHQ